MKIINTQKRMFKTVTGRRLMMGENDFECSEKERALILGNDQFKNWQGLGWVSVAGAPVQMPLASKPVPEPVVLPVLDPEEEEALPGEEGALDGTNLDGARDLIKACQDQELLAVWYERDSRKGVKEAIEKHLDDLEEG